MVAKIAAAYTLILLILMKGIFFAGSWIAFALFIPAWILFFVTIKLWQGEEKHGS